MFYLVANNLYDPGHENQALDDGLAESALELLDILASQTGDKRVLWLRDASAELLQHQRKMAVQDKSAFEVASLTYTFASHDVEYMLSGLSQITRT